MKYISCIFSMLTATILFVLITATNTSIQLSYQIPVFATTEEVEDSSSENSNGSLEINQESKTSQDVANSEQTKVEDCNGSNNDSSPPEQNNNCPDLSGFSNAPAYLGKDGCIYSCPSVDNDMSNDCPVEKSSQSPSGFNINEERPIQSQQQTAQPPQQQNLNSNLGQNTFISPRINSDSTIDNIPNNETTTSTTTQKSFNPAGQYKPGSGQTELTIPGKSDSLTRPYTSGAGNTQLDRIPVQPNTNPQTPIDPEKIVTSLPDKAYLTVITKMMNFYTNYLKVSDFEICVSTTVQSDGNFKDVNAIPSCAKGSGSGVQYTVHAPGLITIWVNNLDELGVKSVMIETPNLNNYINTHESKTSTIYISPYPPQ